MTEFPQMKILYVSVHQILEYDEINLFHKLGHFVFPLGVYFGGYPSQPFRPNLEFAPALQEYMSHFERLGGKFKYGAPVLDQRIPREFVEMFDLVIVMHDFDFIEYHWTALSGTAVIWRGIGVGVQEFEHRVKAVRKRGCHIVRYCPTEQRAVNYAGHDAIIRFGKPDLASAWRGDQPQILTFSNLFRQRFPLDYEFYAKAVDGLPAVLCGDGNGGLPGAAGVVDFRTQQDLLIVSSVYFYAGGTCIPYTLNFMEAWMSGIPVVATDCRSIYSDDQTKFADIPNLLSSGDTGILVDTPEKAAKILRDLMVDHSMSEELGRKGAASAREYFSFDVIGPQWSSFFASVVGIS